MIVGSPTILNLVPGGVMKCVHVNQVNKNIEIQFKVMNGAQPFNVTQGTTCTIRGTKGDAFGYAAAAAVTVGSNVVTVTLTEQLTAVAGAGNIFELVFVASANDMKVSTENFILAVERQAMGEDTVISDSDLSYAEQVLDQLQSVGAVNTQVQQNKTNLEAETAARQAADNTLQSNINAEASTRATTDASLQSQINQLVAPSGSAPSAAEVENARVGADGTVYPTLGDAIRTQVTDVKSALEDIDNVVFIQDTDITTSNQIIIGTTIGEEYTVTVSSTWKSAEIQVEEGNVYKAIFSTPSDNYYRSYIIFCDDSNVIKGFYAKSYNNKHAETVYVTCPIGATRMIVNAYVTSNYTLQIYYPLKDKVEDIDSKVAYINNSQLVETQNYTTNKQLILGTTIGEEYTVTVSSTWRSAEINVEEGALYKVMFSVPNDNYYRSYIVFADDDNVVKGFYANRYSSNHIETVYVTCPVGATRMIVNANVNSGQYTLQIYYSLKEKVTDLENGIKYGPTNGTISRGEIILPSVIYVAPGRQCNLYWSSISNTLDGDKSVYFETKCDIGKNTERAFVIDSDNTMIGNHTIKIVCKDSYSRNILSTYNGTIVISAPQTITGTKNVLMIGDSRTWQRSNGIQGTSTLSDAGKTITAETKSLLAETYNNVFNFIGTEVSPFDSTVKNLAVSGWKITNAMNTIDNAGGIINYVETSCGLGSGASLDVVTIMYGVNDLGDWRANNLDQYNISIAKISGFINHLSTFINTIQTGYPSAKILVVIEPTTCANQDGFGYFGVNTEKDAHIELEQALKVLRKTMIDEIENGNYSNVFLSSAGVWCDRLYNFPYIDEKPSVRTSVKIVPRYVNCVHPHDDGYKQIADGIYSSIISLYQ